MSKFSIRQVIGKIFFVLICLLSITSTIVNPVAIKSSPTNFCAKEQVYKIPSLKDIVRNLFKKGFKFKDGYVLNPYSNVIYHFLLYKKTGKLTRNKII